jgi:hypothetical protein
MRAARSTMTITHHATPLVVRASLPRTFWGLGIVAEAGLISPGVYLLLGAALKSPLEADQMAVICAGVLLALATVLLFYMLSPKRFEALARNDDARSDEPPLEIPLTAYGEALQARQRAEQALEEELLPGPM